MIKAYLTSTQNVSKTMYAVIAIRQKAQSRSLELGTGEDTILNARLHRTVECIEAIPSNSFEYAETAIISLPTTLKNKYMTAKTYVRDFALPNFFFHVVNTFAILRNLGMTLGKRDYINLQNIE